MPTQPFSAPKPRSLPTATPSTDINQTLASWQTQLRPLIQNVAPQATPQNFNVTNSRGGLTLSWAPVSGADGYEILRSLNGSFTDDLQIIPIKNVNQSSYFDPLGGNSTTAHYRIRSTSGTAANPQSQRGPESGVVRHTSIDAADTKSVPVTMFDNATTDITRANARRGNYGAIKISPSTSAASGIQGVSAAVANAISSAAGQNATIVQTTGATRAYYSLDTNYQVASQLNSRQAIASGALVSTTGLSQTGGSTVINVASNTAQIGSNTVIYNSGSVDPGVYGTYYVYADDPTFTGGAVTYVATTNQLDLLSSDDRVPFGKITTSGGGGGGGGGSPSCFSPNTKVKTQRGDIAFWDIKDGDCALTARGTFRRILGVTAREFEGEMLDMGDDELTTLTHHFAHDEKWVQVGKFSSWPVKRYKGIISNLSIEADTDDDGTQIDTERSYVLANGSKVHNFLPT